MVKFAAAHGEEVVLPEASGGGTGSVAPGRSLISGALRLQAFATFLRAKAQKGRYRSIQAALTAAYIR